MATRTFVGDGASHNWSSTGAWVEGAVPTASDDVVVSSNTAGSILVIDGTSGSPSLCGSIDTTGYTRTITFGAGAHLNVGTSTAGAFKMATGMTFAPNASSVITFVSTTTGNNLTFGAYTYHNITFDGVGGGWTLQDNVSGSSGGVGTITLTNGSLDTNSKNVTNLTLSSSNSNVRSLTLGTTSWSIGAFNGTMWDIGTSTNMTLSAASSTIISTAVNNNGTFNGGGLTYGTLQASSVTTGSLTIAGANTFSTLTLSVAGTTKTTTSGYRLSANQTVTGTFTATGNSLILRNFIYSDTVGIPRTISAGTFAITNTDLRDITKAGAGSGDISATSSTTGNGDCGGNSGWTFQAPRNAYMKTAVSVNWSAANWYTTSGGGTLATPPLPLCQDNAVVDVNSVTATGKTITVDQPRIASTDWTGVANTPALSSATAFEVYGSMLLVSGMTHTGVGTATFAGRGSYTLDGGGLTWPASSTIIVNAPGGTLSLARNITSNAGLAVAGGTFSLASFNPTVTGITVSGGAISGAGAITGTTYTQTGGTVTLGGTLTLTGATAISGGTLDMNGYNETGATTLAVSGTGTLNLSGQFLCSSTITVSGGTVANTGSSGELKTTGNSLITFSGGNSTCMKVTEGGTSNIVVSGTGSLTIPVGGVVSWTTGLFEVTGASALFSTGGTVTGTSSTLSVTSSSSGGSFTFG